jgi:arylsulfatase
MSFSRRDFLKLLAHSPLLMTADQLSSFSLRQLGAGSGLPNVIVFVFDAFSAKHLSLYGYPRQTTPNIDKFAGRCTVYHSHYAGGNFTSSGTASLLTGTYPWTHRAIQYGGLVARRLAAHDIFDALGDARYKLAYSQNPWADNLLQQFRGGIDDVLDTSGFNLGSTTIANRLFQKDPIIADRGLDGFAADPEFLPGSIWFSMLRKLRLRYFYSMFGQEYAGVYPLGLPTVLNSSLDAFTLEDLFKGMAASISTLPRDSSLAYYHIYPPHFPVKPQKKFAGAFTDGWAPPAKPTHALASKLSAAEINAERDKYDEYIASIDFEFGALLAQLEQAGILDNSYVILTSDHGELHERGELWHLNPFVYEELTRVPLLISAPGSHTRADVQSVTSCVDLLPTLMHLSHLALPDWAEGRLLPGFGGVARSAEAVFTIDAKTESSFQALQYLSVAMVKGQHKLIYYNYPHYAGRFEFYDLQNDPEELDDLFTSDNPIATTMRAELEQKLAQANAPFHHG